MLNDSAKTTQLSTSDRIQGTDDGVYWVANAQDEIVLFTGSITTELRVINEGQHFCEFIRPRDGLLGGGGIHSPLELRL